MRTRTILALASLGLSALSTSAQFAPATDDLWDVSQGTIVILSSTLATPPGSANPYDGRDAIGGTFTGYAPEAGNILFASGSPEGTTKVIQWRTRKPVTVKSFRLFAHDDPVTGDHGIGLFRLKAKSSGSVTFDTVLFEFSPSHPFVYQDPGSQLLIASSVKPVEAQEFAAEFVTYNGQGGVAANGPRIIELDGLADTVGVRPVIRTSETEISWISAPAVPYQVQYRENLTGSTWQALGATITGTGGFMTVTDKLPSGCPERFYRVIPVE